MARSRQRFFSSSVSESCSTAWSRRCTENVSVPSRIRENRFNSPKALSIARFETAACSPKASERTSLSAAKTPRGMASIANHHAAIRKRARASGVSWLRVMLQVLATDRSSGRYSRSCWPYLSKLQRTSTMKDAACSSAMGSRAPLRAIQQRPGCRRCGLFWRPDQASSAWPHPGKEDRV
jgi:hypothetical protein